MWGKSEKKVEHEQTVTKPLISNAASRNFHIRPYPLEYTGSRPLSPSQTSEG
ncbi:hypothetical protein M9X92_004381 [Pyricularia oryzae]|nr:hypothetical protein M9X92_004381 [Pyricularia oryzae]